MTTVVMTMDVAGLTHEEFRAILNEMGVEERPEPGIYEHISHPTDTGMRIIEIWDSQAGFEEFAEETADSGGRPAGDQSRDCHKV